MFSPLFLPFYQQGSGKDYSWKSLRDYYRRLFSHPFCLGIFSHIPETMQNISTFFQSDTIDRKLYSSRIGLSAASLPTDRLPGKGPVATPTFFFCNSAHQNPANFWKRGGHIVLRFWKEYRTGGKTGYLFLRCERPSDQDLTAYGVDPEFLRQENGKSLFWIENFLTNSEMNALMAAAHFFLLPSLGLHSASILQAMALGSVPVVTDTLGTSRYIVDDQNGLILKGVWAHNWKKDTEADVFMDTYRKDESLDTKLVSQLSHRVIPLIEKPDAYHIIQANTMAAYERSFSGEDFCTDFWSAVGSLYEKRLAASEKSPEPFGWNRSDYPGDHCPAECFLGPADWSRVFESCPQPVLKLYTGFGSVYELAGAFLCLNNKGWIGKPKMDLHDWSVLSEFLDKKRYSLHYAVSLEEAVGNLFENMDRKGKRSYPWSHPAKESIKAFLGEEYSRDVKNVYRRFSAAFWNLKRFFPMGH
jgi:hypothetical protein